MSIVHRYYLPRTADDSWSVWLVDEDTGTLCIFGDYGNWTHTWGVAGRVQENRHDFRRELLRFDHHYIGRKLAGGVPREIDMDATVAAIRRAVLRLRRARRLTAGKASEAWEALDELSHGEIGIEQFIREHDDGFDLWEDIVDEPHEADWLRHLMSVTLPRFREAVQRDLESSPEVANG